MRYKVYTRDWYYNAGIIGFLFVLSEGERDIEQIIKNFNNQLIIDENYIEFDSSLVENYYQKYEKLAFSKFFDLDSYRERLVKLIEEIKKLEKKVPQKILAKSGLGGKVVNIFFENFHGMSLENLFEKFQYKESILSEVTKIKEKLDIYRDVDELYKFIIAKNPEFVSYFLDLEVNKRICNFNSIENYIRCLRNGLVENENNSCFICQKYKKEHDFSNAITQVIGFNNDNANWIWGYNTSKVKICSLCALIYASALHGMIFLRKNIQGELKSHFYFLNRNIDIKSMYSSSILFKEKIYDKENQNKPYYTIIKEVVMELIRNNAQNVLENINFVTIEENEFGGQSTKAYNVYNFNITPELAKFIQIIQTNDIPKGYYIIKEHYNDITEEILEKTLNMSLSYEDLNNYFQYYIQEKSFYSLYRVTSYILKYLFYLNGGRRMDSMKKIVKKAFANGFEIRKKIESDNKIKGIAYQLLNDLKIGDKNAFIDKYLRLSMSYQTEVRLGSNNELIDIDNFMQFGYAFINGILSQEQSENNNMEAKND